MFLSREIDINCVKFIQISVCIKVCIKIVGLKRINSAKTQPFENNDIPEEPKKLRLGPIII